MLSNIHYVGDLPAFKYWPDFSLDDYEFIAERFKQVWDFKEQAIRYCKIDCVALFEVLIKFNELIFNTFGVNIHRSLTLPSLAMRIFKSKFMPENTIYQLGGQVEEDIRQSYTGGHVDVYRPHNDVGFGSLMYEG